MAAKKYPEGFYTNSMLKTIYGSFNRKFGDARYGEALILTKSHKKALSDYVEMHDDGAATVLVAWLGYLWDCECQDDWETTKFKAHRFITNMEGYWQRGNGMLPFAWSEIMLTAGTDSDTERWEIYLLKAIEEQGLEVIKEPTSDEKEWWKETKGRGNFQGWLYRKRNGLDAQRTPATRSRVGNE